MMHPREIEYQSRKAARESCRLGKLPYIVWPQDLATWRAAIASGVSPRLPFPALGDRTPRGYKLERELFVDSSGWGYADEPATTIPDLINSELRTGFAYSIGDIGQFQLYLREWRPPVSKLADVEQSKPAVGNGEHFVANEIEPVIVIMHKAPAPTEVN